MKLQFGLPTLMIVVTLLAVALGYVGWQAKIVREREAYLKANAHDWQRGTHITISEGNRDKAPSGIRTWLGDKPQEWVFFEYGKSSGDVQYVAALFPEADVMSWP